MEEQEIINKAPNMTHEERKMLNSKRVAMDVSVFEAAIIRVIRNIPQGNVTIHILSNIPVRYTLGASYMIDPTEDQNMLAEVAKQGSQKGGGGND